MIHILSLSHSHTLSLSLQIHCDLVQVATRGAMLAIDGYILALNPGDQEKSAHVTIT